MHLGGDPRVGPALRHKLKHRTFPVAELLEQAGVLTPPEQPLDHFPVEYEFTVSHTMQIGHQSLDSVDPILKQVPHSATVLVEKARCRGHFHVRGKKKDPKVRVASLELPGHLEAFDS